MQEETKRLEAVNETMRAESQSGDPFVRRARPALIWTMAVTWGIQMFCLSAAVLFYPEKAGALIKSIGELTSMWGIALGVIGVYFKARSDDKKTAAGVPAPSMFEVDEVVAPARDLDLRAIPGARIEGTVVDEGGRPAEGVTVLAAAEDREDRDWRVTGADGRFVLQGLRAGTEYTIRGYVDEAVPWEGKATAPTTGLRLVIETGFHAAGRVVGAEGEPLAFTQLRFVAEGHEAPNAYCETDAQGRFEVAGLRDGAYRAQRYPKVVLKVDDPAPEWIDIGTVRARTRDVVLHAK